jgi:hypothetical protein
MTVLIHTTQDEHRENVTEPVCLTELQQLLLLFWMCNCLQKMTHQEDSIEASLEDRQQNFDLTADKSKLMAKLHPCTEIDER